MVKVCFTISLVIRFFSLHLANPSIFKNTIKPQFHYFHVSTDVPTKPEFDFSKYIFSVTDTRFLACITEEVFYCDYLSFLLSILRRNKHWFLFANSSENCNVISRKKLIDIDVH